MKYALAILLTSVASSHALADTWAVSASGKADFTTIQEAVDAAACFDDVLVMPVRDSAVLECNTNAQIQKN
ncbi:MAG: hypothetical protein H8E86_06650 [Planctomycetes bacterium]|nr:hypothetical protein [Planctomycetota bacterium]